MALVGAYRIKTALAFDLPRQRRSVQEDPAMTIPG